MSSKTTYKKGLVVSQDLINDSIQSIEYQCSEISGTIVCCLKLQNGFVVTGTAASLPTTEFDASIGSAWARKDAESKVALLLGFLACERMKDNPISILVDKVLDTLKEQDNG